ncbi:MAG: ABC transporter ATP-binding protein/permease [Gemmatimonadaceae bacterium]|jgi:ABC-type bacteriocin/lantibiotic exporter with double-glycine peptidase domain|nr:ABC transporter ATP-binding protein/permease [Gemmatimonadaceae bacterium]
MPAQQATRINQLITEALGLEVEQSHWRAVTRQLPPNGTLASRLRIIGGTVDVGYLDRTFDRDALRAAISDRIAPLVLFGAATDEAVLLLRTDEDEVHALVVGTEGYEDAIHGQGDQLADAIIRRLGGNGTIEGVAPMGLRPSFASVSVDQPHSGTGMGHDADDHEHLTPVERTLRMFAREKKEILLVFFYATFAGALSLVLPLAVGGIVTLVQGRLFLQPVIVLISVVILGTIVAGVIQIGLLRVVERIQQRVFARMALEFAFRIPRLQYRTSLESNLPEQMNRLFEAVAIQKGVQKLLLDVPTAALTILFGLILLTLYSPWFSVFAVVVCVALWLIIRWTGPKGLETSIVESKYKYKAVHWLEEVARAFHAFKFAGDSSLPVERMDDVVTGYLKYRRKHFAVLVQQTIALIGFKTFITAAVLIVGATLVQTNRLLLGQFVAAEVVIVTVLTGVEKLITSLSTVYDILTSVDKAGHVVDLPLETRGGLAPVSDPRRGVAIEARDLAYRYPGAQHPSVRGVSIDIAPGERVAIVGFDGSGRSTFLRLLGGLMDDYDGVIRYDGLTLRDMDRPAMRARVGQMLSWSDLFDGTIEENISVGRVHITSADVRRALEAVGVDDEVQHLPQGVQTEITNGGRNLPAHLANKLLVAQCIVGEPRLVVLDDFFQNLDISSRAMILKLLTDRTRPWTVVAVSHDPQLLRAFDRVIVVQDGKIVREGSFDAITDDAYTRHLLDDLMPARA